MAPGWQRLADIALEPNVFFEPWNFEPALKAFGASKTSTLLFAYHSACDQGQTPILFMPFEERAQVRGLPGRVLSAWHHPYSPLSTPLLHPKFAHEAWRAVFGWACSNPQATSLLEFPQLLSEGPSHHALLDVLREDKLHTFTVERYTRAALLPKDEGKARGVGCMLSSGRRKELRRQRRRLEDLGRFEVRSLAHTDAIDPWLDQFLKLEAAGWKGQSKTAFACDTTHEAYFRAICRGAFARHQLHTLGLFVDGKPIALKINFVSQDGAFAFKIAYDENLNKYSPGVLLELETILNLKTSGRVSWVDSCATADHGMINSLWTQRRTIEHLLVSTGARGHLQIALLQGLRSLKRIRS